MKQAYNGNIPIISTNNAVDGWEAENVLFAIEVHSDNARVRIVLDMTKTMVVRSDGEEPPTAVLGQAATHLLNCGGKLVVFGVSEEVRKQMGICLANAVIVATLEEAIAECQSE